MTENRQSMWYTAYDMKIGLRLIIFMIFLFWARPISSVMSGNTFTIYADTFNFIDTASTSGDTFFITVTGGEVAATSTSGNTFELRGGFQAAEQGILSFSVSPSSLTIGPLSLSAVSTAGVDLIVSTDSETGYTITLVEDANLRFGSNDINDVSDGSVTAGSEEYGIITSGSDAQISSDTALSGTLTIASAYGRAPYRETTVVFRAAMGSNTIAGLYSHVVTFTATVNP